MNDLNGILDLVLKLSPIIVLGIYLGKTETRIEALKDRVEALENEDCERKNVNTEVKCPFMQPKRK